MATVRWRGDAPAIKQVDTLTPANVEIGDIFTATINGKSISFTATAATVANVTAGLADAINDNDDSIPEFSEVTATDDTTLVTVTADGAGKPFTMTASATDGGGTDTQTLSQATSTSATGPNHWSEADNWDGGSVPVNSDDVYIDQGSSDILYGLDQSAVTLTSLSITQNYTGKIGLPEVNGDDPGNVYFEYRDTYLKIKSTTVTIGSGDGNGSGRIKLDGSTAQTTLNVLNSGQAAEAGIPSILWKGTHASNVANIMRGSVGAAFFSGETATVATLRVGYVENPAGDSRVVCGAGVTLTNVDQSGGTLKIDSATTTFDQTDGQSTILSGAHAELNIDGGSCFYRSTGTITTARVGGGAELDFGRDMRSRTVTNCELHARGTMLDPFKTATFTNGIDVTRSNLGDVTLDLGTHLTVTRSAI